MKIGDIELLAVTDGTLGSDGGGAFGLVPKTMWQKWLAERQALIIFQHDPLIIAGKLVMQNKRRKAEAVVRA